MKHKREKRILSIVLTLALLLAFSGVPAALAASLDDLTITVGSATARAGDSLSIPITLSNNAGTGNADVNDALGLSRTVVRARHERVVFDGIGKNYQFEAGAAVRIIEILSSSFYNASHKRNGVHIYPGSGSCYIDA